MSLRKPWERKVDTEYFDTLVFFPSDGLKAYTAPVGHVMHLSGTPVYLNDSTYDGSTEQG